MIDLMSPPGFPDDDDDSPDGGGPPRRASALAAIDRIQRRTAALTEARIAAQLWANVSGESKYVIENAGRFFLADDQDLAVYHQADLDAGRAVIAWTAEPPAPTIAAPDVSFAPAGWGDAS